MGVRARGGVAVVAAAMTMALLGACAGEAVDEPPSSDATPQPSDAPEDDASDGEESPSEEPIEDEETPGDEETSGSERSDWQTVEYGDATFSVPESWDVTYEEVDGEEVPRTSYGQGYCEAVPEEALGVVINTWVEGVTDPVEAVRTEAEQVAQTVFGDRIADLEVGDVRHSGAWASVPATLQLTASDDPCAASEGLVVVKGFAYEDGSGTGLFIVVGELGLPDSPTPEDLVEIANSFG